MTTRNLPPEVRDPILETILEARGLAGQATLTMVPIGGIDWDRTRKANPRGEPVDHDTVERYVGALERGEHLPAGLGQATGSNTGFVVGGEHRALAHKAHGSTHLPLYVLAETADQWAVHLAGIEHNSRHGRPMSVDRAAGIAARLIDAGGLTQAEAAATVGLKVTQVRRVLVLGKGQKRAKKVGQGSVWEALPRQPRFLMSTIADRLSDDVFAEMVMVANNVDIDTATATALVDGIKALPPDGGGAQLYADDAVFAYLEEFETAYHHAAASTGYRGTGTSPAVVLRQATLKIGDLNPERVAGAVTEGFAVPTLGTVRRAIDKLRKIEAAILAEHPDCAQETPKQALLR